MNTSTAILLSFVGLSFTACGDDGDIFTTINWTATNVTHANWTQGNGATGEGVAATEDIPTTGTDTVTTGETDAIVDTSTTDATGVTEAGTTTGDDTSSSSSSSPTETLDGESTGAAEPQKIVPTGCAHFVEIEGHTPVARRYAIVNAGACDPAARLSIEWTAGTLPEGTTVTMVGQAEKCAAYGPRGSAVTGDSEWVSTTIEGAVALTIWRARLLVDGVKSDEVQLPVALTGQEYPYAPGLPQSAIRRVEDFSWRVVPEHIGGCDLSAIDL